MKKLPEVSVNFLAVLVAVIVSMVLGGLWYGPVFGKKWMALMGWTPEIAEQKKKGASKAYIGMFIGSLLVAYVLSHIIDFAGATTWTAGAIGGFWIWLGFIVPLLAGNSLWEGRPWDLFFINSSYQLINLLVIGALLAVWA